VTKAEAREQEALSAAAAAKAHALTVGDNEVKLRSMLTEQGAQLDKAGREEAIVREALRQSQAVLAETTDRLEHVDSQLSAATKRCEKAERVARDAREALSQARGTQSECEALMAQLAEARQQAANYKAQMNEESNARRALGVSAKESRSALLKLKEETDAQRAEDQAAMARELALQRERLGALRHVNGALEGRLRALFDSRNKELGKATTLQEAVQMLTDEYVVVVDQLKSTQESLAAEQRHSANVEGLLSVAREEARVSLAREREAEANLSSMMVEVTEHDIELVPLLSRQAVELAEARLHFTELQRRDAQQTASNSRRVQQAESVSARSQESNAALEAEVALLKKRLTNSLKRTRELQQQLDDHGASAGGRHWVPAGNRPDRSTPPGARGVPPRAPGRGGGSGRGGGGGGVAKEEAAMLAALEVEDAMRPLEREHVRIQSDYRYVREEEMPSPLTVTPVAFTVN